MNEPEPALVWGIVEVMGHNSYGGVLLEVEQLGVKFLRVTVPETERNREFSVDLSASSIFRIRRCTEETARAHYSTIPEDCRKERAPLPASRLLPVDAVDALYDDIDDAEHDSNY